ncbi:hypothetical protein [Nocardioides panaciterrulae]|uniref:Uncharacterized protein n=1 Tax=Nocardioides panaciterrulae TaxID=661492 RepID=A0A7Y9E7T6_9ACTN|nr:hypothetical protein [Nocardioides panaciterrulae]NYD42693.1 hypothetical protein [Nocardioides panaciterrulae]
MLSTDKLSDAEVGIFIGWNACDASDTHFYINPTVFRQGHSEGGVAQCTAFTTYHPDDDTFDTYSVSDVNTANTYQFFWNGTSLGTHSYDFTQGYNAVGTERKSDDPGKAKFHDLNEFHEGNGWTVWNTLSLYSDNDSDWKLDIVDGHTGNVVTQ